MERRRPALYYVSEHLRHAGQHRLPATVPLRRQASQAVKQITFHKDDSVRRARISGNGEWIVYECGAGSLGRLHREDGKPRKLAIEVNADDKANTERIVTFTSGITEFALSPDEKIRRLRGPRRDVPDAGRTGAKATQIDHRRAYDHGIAWSPDGSKILFFSDRNGHEDLYLLEPDDPDIRS